MHWQASSLKCIIILLLLIFSFGTFSLTAVAGIKRDDPGARAVDAYQSGDYETALTLAKDYAERTKAKEGDTHRDYAFALILEALISYHLGGEAGEAALPLLNQAVEIFRGAGAAGYTDLANAQGKLADYYSFIDRLKEAEANAQQAVETLEKAKADSGDIAVAVARLGDLYYSGKKYEFANVQYSRARVLVESKQPADADDLIAILNRIAKCGIRLRNYKEADESLARAVNLLLSAKGKDDPGLAELAQTGALLNEETGHVEQAEEYLHLGFEAVLRSRDLNLISGYLNATALFFERHGRYADAEDALKRALSYLDKPGQESLLLATVLNNLATVQMKLGQSDPTVMMLAGRAHRIRTRILGDTNPETLAALMNAVEAIIATHDEDSMWIWGLALTSACNKLQKAVPAGDPAVILCLNNLGHLYLLERRFSEASEVLNDALKVATDVYGRQHPETARILLNLASTYEPDLDFDKAVPLLEEAISTFRNTLGEHADLTAQAINNLAWLRNSQQNWAEAEKLFKQAAAIRVHRFEHEDREGTEGGQSAVQTRSESAFQGYIEAAYHLSLSDAARKDSLTDEAFKASQWVSQSAAGKALKNMSARFAAADASQDKKGIASLVRERQNLNSALEALDKRFIEFATDPDQRTGENGRNEVRQKTAEIEQRLREIDRALPKNFAALVAPKPLSLAETQNLLRPNEALVQLILQEDSGFGWVVTRDRVEWKEIELGSKAAAELVHTLRCGLDEDGEWETDDSIKWRPVHPYCAPYEKERNETGMPPFQFGVAQALYTKIFGQFESVLQGKQLLIVAPGALASLPFQVLVTAPLPPGRDGIARYRNAKWLGVQQPLVTLPTVASLHALRGLGKSRPHAPFAYAGIGNPLLKGDENDAYDVQRAKLAETFTDCSKVTEQSSENAKKSLRPIPLDTIVHGQATDIEAVRHQRPLPETAEELCAIGRELKAVPEREKDAIWLGPRATESNVKKLNEDGELKRYAIVHFATHGALAAESEQILKAGAEPGLILTPPNTAKGTPQSGEALARDDGVLSASEIAHLDLNADWVILSACNTAAPNNQRGEALSGLARAFFYAGASAVLVSHWYVDSDASVKLTTHTFLELQNNAEISRGEALRRAIVFVMNDTSRPTHWLPAVHPAVWAPFVLAGEGDR